MSLRRNLHLDGAQILQINWWYSPSPSVAGQGVEKYLNGYPPPTVQGQKTHFYDLTDLYVRFGRALLYRWKSNVRKYATSSKSYKLKLISSMQSLSFNGNIPSLTALLLWKAIRQSILSSLQFGRPVFCCF